MSFDLQHILENKLVHRRGLAALPVAEKLRMLDAMRERELSIRGRELPMNGGSSVVREDPTPYGASKRVFTKASTDTGSGSPP